jgi:hypothetical protein
MNPRIRWRHGGTIGLLLVLLGSSAGALERGTSPAGVAFVSGGVSQAEQAEMLAEQGQYSFWLTTAARRSGAFMSDVRVRITEAESGRTVLDHRLDGSWLFAALPPGRYEVEAIHLPEAMTRLEIQRGARATHPGDHQRMVLYFAMPEADGAGAAAVAPEPPAPR